MWGLDCDGVGDEYKISISRVDLEFPFIGGADDDDVVGVRDEDDDK